MNAIETSEAKDGLASPTLSMLEVLQFAFIGAITLPHLIDKMSALDITQAALFDVAAIVILVLTVVLFLTVKSRRLGSIYFRLDKTEYEQLVLATPKNPGSKYIRFTSLSTMREMSTVKNVDLWYSTCLDVAAQFILKMSHMIVYLARVNFSYSPKTDAPKSLFKEWTYDVNHTKNSYQRFTLSKNIFVNAIIIAAKHGIFRNFRK